MHTKHDANEQDADEAIIDATPRELMDIAQAVPSHLRLRGWFAPDKPVFGQRYIYADDFMGAGRQAIASVACMPGSKELSAFIARFDPATVAQLLFRMTHTERVNTQLNDAMQKAVEMRVELRALYKQQGLSQEEIEERMQPFLSSKVEAS